MESTDLPRRCAAGYPSQQFIRRINLERICSAARIIDLKIAARKCLRLASTDGNQ